MRARQISGVSFGSNRIVRTFPELTWVSSAHRVPSTSSTHADVTRHIVPAAAAVAVAIHVLTAAACARAAAARRLNVARWLALSWSASRSGMAYT
jgi:hypothetical protein